MPDLARFVADTNVLVSRLLFRHSLPAQALRHAMASHQLIVSTDTLVELGAVLSRTKFDRYVPLADRLQFFDRLRRIVIQIPHVAPIAACRDPKDDKFLARISHERAIPGTCTFSTRFQTEVGQSPSVSVEAAGRLQFLRLNRKPVCICWIDA